MGKLKLPARLNESSDFVPAGQPILPFERARAGRTLSLALERFDCEFQLLIDQRKPRETDLVVQAPHYVVSVLHHFLGGLLVDSPVIILFHAAKGLFNCLKQCKEIALAVLQEAFEHVVRAFYAGSHAHPKVAMVFDRKMRKFVADGQVCIAEIVDQICRHPS